MYRIKSTVTGLTLILLMVFSAWTSGYAAGNQPMEVGGTHLVISLPNGNVDGVPNGQVLAFFEDWVDSYDILETANRPDVAIYLNQSVKAGEDDLGLAEDDPDVTEVADPEGLRVFGAGPTVAVYLKTPPKNGDDGDRLGLSEDDPDVIEVADPEGRSIFGPGTAVVVYLKTPPKGGDKGDPLGLSEDDPDVIEVADPEGRRGTRQPLTIVIYLPGEHEGAFDQENYVEEDLWDQDGERAYASDPGAIATIQMKNGAGPVVLLHPQAGRSYLRQ